MQGVVEASGEVEEVQRGVEDEPAGVDAGAAGVEEDRPKHLGHAAALSGRIDVPDNIPRPPLASLPGKCYGLGNRVAIE